MQRWREEGQEEEEEHIQIWFVHLKRDIWRMIDTWIAVAQSLERQRRPHAVDGALAAADGRDGRVYRGQGRQCRRWRSVERKIGYYHHLLCHASTYLSLSLIHR
jgi:hypothetical protein